MNKENEEVMHVQEGDGPATSDCVSNNSTQLFFCPWAVTLLILSALVTETTNPQDNY